MRLGAGRRSCQLPGPRAGAAFQTPLAALASAASARARNGAYAPPIGSLTRPVPAHTAHSASLLRPEPPHRGQVVSGTASFIGTSPGRRSGFVGSGGVMSAWPRMALARADSLNSQAIKCHGLPLLDLRSCGRTIERARFGPKRGRLCNRPGAAVCVSGSSGGSKGRLRGKQRGDGGPGSGPAAAAQPVQRRARTVP